LIVELDGGQHADQKEADEERTRWLASQGFRVVRFWNNDVLTNISGVMQVIEKNLLPLSPPSNRVLRASPGYPTRGEGDLEKGEQ